MDVELEELQEEEKDTYTDSKEGPAWDNVSPFFFVNLPDLPWAFQDSNPASSYFVLSFAMILVCFLRVYGTHQAKPVDPRGHWPGHIQPLVLGRSL